MRLIRSLGLALAVLFTPGAQAADDPQTRTVETVYASFQGAVKDGPGTLQSRIDAVGPALEQNFDFPVMVRLAVGQVWSRFSAEEQGAITEAFRRNFVVTYANRLSQAAGGKFEVTGKGDAQGPNAVVLTKVTTPDGDESQVDFIVNPDNRVQDVLLNGNVSEVASQRAAFAEPLKSGGADGLLKFLRQRTEGMLAAKRAP